MHSIGWTLGVTPSSPKVQTSWISGCHPSTQWMNLGPSLSPQPESEGRRMAPTVSRLDIILVTLHQIEWEGQGQRTTIILKATKSLTSDTKFTNYLLIINAYSKIPKPYGLEKITTEEVMDDMDMFQSRFVKIEEFGWWDLEIFSADAGKKFTSTKFKEEFQTCEVHLMLAA